MRRLAECVEDIYDDDAGNPEDIFASAAGALWTDTSRNFHGSEFSMTVYNNDTLPDVKLRMATPHPRDTEYFLYAYHLWNASILMSEKLTGKRLEPGESMHWPVKGEEIIELGAGAGLAGIVAALVGAHRVALSDFPTTINLTTLRNNVAANIPQDVQSRVSVDGHRWGECDHDDFALRNKNAFSTILAADLYWMADRHDILVKSMLHFLSHAPGARIHAIGGFHTGRDKLAHFFDVAVEHGLHVDDIYEEFHTGERRPWQKEPREDESTETRKLWLVVARLSRALL